LQDAITYVIETYGYFGVAFLIALENVFPPIPSEVILPLTGFLAGRGLLSLPGAMLAATAGSVIGALILYGLGRWVSEARLRAIVKRFGRPLMLRETDLDRALGWFDRHGAKAVFLCRLVPVVRSLISVPAGLAAMPLGTFVAYTTLGSGIWNTALLSLGWALGERWDLVLRYAGYFEYAVLIALAGAVVWFFWSRRTAKSRRG
jgi:membrane protein DedA with SNARE-associated domain